MDRCAGRRAVASGPSLPNGERAVLEAFASGLSTDETADRLDLDAEAVRSHLRSAMVRLGGHTRLETVLIAIRNDLLPGFG